MKGAKGKKPPASQKAPVWAWVLGTWFGSGWSPFAPGTAGTAASLPLAWALGALLPAAWGGWSPWCLLASLLLFYPAVLAATHVEAALGVHDPGPVVVDETLGTLLTMAFLPSAAYHSWQAYVAAFFLFRFFDVWKPGVIGRSQALPQGWGIVVDDVLAGLLGGVILLFAWIRSWQGLAILILVPAIAWLLRKRDPKSTLRGPDPPPEFLEAEMGSKNLSQWRRTQEHWNDDIFLAETANAFMKRRWRRLNRRVADFCGAEARRLARGLDLLDVGCAHADFESWSRPHLASYTGIEPSKALLPKNRSEGRAFRVLRGKAEKLPCPAQSADLVLLKEVLDHCYDPAAVLKEAQRVLRPGGCVLLTLTNDRAWYKRALPARAARIKAGQDDHLFFFHPDWIRELLLGAGFEELGEEDSHYLRLPYRLEAPLGRLPEACTDALLSATDGLGALVLPGMGGSFWSWGRKAAAAKGRA